MRLKASADWPYQAAAGGVVVKKNDQTVALLYRNSSRNSGFQWHLPKGIIESGESLEATAIREVEEETALEVNPIAYLGALNQTIPAEVAGFAFERVVHYFLLEWQANTPNPIDPEHDSVKWVSFDQAIELLKDSPKREGEIVQRAQDWLKRHGG